MPRDSDKEKQLRNIVLQYGGRTVAMDDSSITVSIPSDESDPKFVAHARREGFSLHREPQPSGRHSADNNWYKFPIPEGGG